MAESSYDLIVIGSGIGGLTLASIMAQLGDRKVLVLERHFKLGGFTHAFERQGYMWDVGLHYVGGMAPGSSLRNLCDMVTGGGVTWHPVPEPYDTFVFPDHRFEVPSNSKEFEAALIRAFPEEARAIRGYFKDIRKASAWLGRHFAQEGLPRFIGSIMERLGVIGEAQALGTTRSYMDRQFRSERLKGLLTSQWGDYGLPPAQSPFALHALIATHYFHGAYYPVGGGGAIAESIVPIIEAKGGRALVRHEVTEILLEGKKAVGVRARHGDREVEFRAPVIVSDAGAHTTYLHLLAPRVIPFRDALMRFMEAHPASSAVTLFLGLSEHPGTLGLSGGNAWIYAHHDQDRNFAERNDWLEGGVPPAMYLSFPSARDPEAKQHTATIIAPADFEPFAPWQAGAWKRRGQDYEQLKERLSRAILEGVERHYPGFSKLVTYQELATPVTNTHFSNHARGMIYGIPSVPDRFKHSKSPWIGARTPVPGLYLTGTDAACLGIAGAMMGGYVTACNLLGSRTPELLRVMRPGIGTGKASNGAIEPALAEGGGA